MHAHRHAAPQRGEQMCRINPLLVSRVADLVNGGIKAIERVRRAGAGGDPHIETGAGGKRVHRLVDPAMFDPVAKRLRQFFRDRQLSCLVKMARQGRWRRLIADRCTQRHQPWAQGGEHRT